ncbi:MAG: hypothetical protein CMJ46_02195 [Planctomyces sp.]|nr:hypothetical protein [Planctomyces sp.]
MRVQDIFEKEMARIGSPLATAPYPADYPGRSSLKTIAQFAWGNRDVVVIQKSRAQHFFTGFFQDDYCFAGTELSYLSALCEVIHRWVIVREGLDMFGEYPSITLNANISVIDPEVMETEWRSIYESINSNRPELVEFVRVAIETEELRHLFPFTSLERFCFSRRANQPFTTDLPSVCSKPDGTYKVIDRWTISEEPPRILGQGSAEDAREILLDFLNQIRNQ